MANDSPAAPVSPADQAMSSIGTQLSAAERARLSQCYQRGTQNIVANVDYAIEMFTACVVGDPGNAVYIQSLMGVLKKKHGPKKSGGLAAFWSKAGALRKLAAASQWREVLKQGAEALRSNPYDVACLLVMADACGGLGLSDARRVYLKNALDSAPADPEVNRQCAKFLAECGDFDQAIACWVRVSNVKNLSDEAERAIASLQVEKTIAGGHGMTGRAAVKPGAAGKAGSAAAAASGPVDRATELRMAIVERPTEIDAYLELADLLERDATVEEAEAMLTKAMSASGGDLKVREHIEDRQLRWARQKVLVAEKRLAAEDTPANRGTLERLRSAQVKQEVEVFSARCARYPENLAWRYELGLRLKAAGNFGEAIKQFQEVLQEPRRKGVVSLELGECFQKIKQYQLALRNYVVAVESLTGDREVEQRKRALYRAGVLASGLEDTDTARKYLSELAGLDYGYRDVAQRLDKIASVKDKGG